MAKASLATMDSIHGVVAQMILDELEESKTLSSRERINVLSAAMTFLHRNNIEVGLVEQDGEITKIATKVRELSESQKDGNDSELMPSEEIFSVLGG